MKKLLPNAAVSVPLLLLALAILNALDFGGACY